MKVAINPKFGGFFLSVKAIKLYVKKKYNKELFVYELECKDYASTGFFVKNTADELDDKFIPRIFLTKDYGERIPEDYDNIVDNNDIISEYEITKNRTDKALIETIEELGRESYAPDTYLKIVEIPDDVDFYISEDEMGYERIEEQHRVWY